MAHRPTSSSLVFLTTLIDLLVQIVFLFILMIGYLGVKQSEVMAFVTSTGLSVSELHAKWRRLVDVESLEKGLVEKQKQVEASLREKDEELERLKAENSKYKAKGGRDLPPCWAKDNSVEYLLSIQIQEGGLLVRPAWEPDRELSANALGLYKDQVDRLYKVQAFREKFGYLKQQTNDEGMKCLHYVIVTDDPDTSKSVYKRHLAVIESIFYKRLFEN